MRKPIYTPPLPKNGLLKGKKGFALLIVLGFGMIVGIMSIAMIEQSILTLRLSRNKIESTQAYYAAQAGLELARLELKKFAPGSPTIGSYVIDANTRVDWEIELQQSKGSDNYYYLPVPGTGDAGQNCKTYGEYVRPINPEHPCNWNKISVGQTVNVPLYYYKADGDDGIIDPAEDDGVDGTLDLLDVKLRTPCIDGSYNAGCERYRFNLDVNAKNSFYDDTIVHWEITGSEKTNPAQIYVLQPVSVPSEDVPDGRISCWNTEIFESWIDDAYTLTNGQWNLCTGGIKYVILATAGEKGIDINGTDGLITNFLKNVAPWNTQNIHKPLLKLSLIHSLEINNPYNTYPAGKVIPYLEYQIITNRSVSNSKQIIKATGKSNNFVQELVLQKDQEGPIGGFVIQN